MKLRAVTILAFALAGCRSDPADDIIRCSTTAAITNPKDYSEMVQIKGGLATIGSEKFHAEEGPVRSISVGDFLIDRHEVTNSEFADFVEATGYKTSAERAPLGGAVFTPGNGISLSDAGEWWRIDPTANWRFPHGADGPAAAPSQPVVQVTPEDALAYARWRGRDLPTEAEWEYAAKGGLTDQEYSWETPNPKPAAALANHWQGVFPVRDTGDDGYKGVAPAACFPPNGFGLHDMAGNVWEMTTDDWAQPSAADKSYVIKGGSWLCADNYCLRYRPAARQPGDPTLGSDHIGFRTIKRIANRGQ